MKNSIDQSSARPALSEIPQESTQEQYHSDEVVNGTTGGFKRRLSDADDEFSPNNTTKKLATEKDKCPENESVKRKCDDENDTIPSKRVALGCEDEENFNETVEYNNIELQYDVKNIKKEKADDLDLKMHDLVLGEVILKVRTDLVKKEPVSADDPNRHQKNFKKFKKVWPLKMQMSAVIPKTTRSIIIPT